MKQKEYKNISKKKKEEIKSQNEYEKAKKGVYEKKLKILKKWFFLIIYQF